MRDLDLSIAAHILLLLFFMLSCLLDIYYTNDKIKKM
jgi:hypothetical protein